MSFFRIVLALFVIASGSSVFAAEKKSSTGVLDDLGRDLKKTASSVGQDLEQTGKKAKQDISKTVKKTKEKAVPKKDPKKEKAKKPNPVTSFLNKAKKKGKSVADSANKTKEKFTPKKDPKSSGPQAKKPNPVSAFLTKAKKKGNSVVSGIRNRFAKPDTENEGTKTGAPKENKPAKASPFTTAPAPNKK
jgi:hypothetical protein